MSKLFTRALLPVLALWLTGTASASTLILSDLSSDSTPASVLDATLDFNVVGTQLTLSVTNDTTAPDTYRVTEVAFNATANVTGLTLVSATSDTDGDVTAGWTLNTAAGMDGFGIFDFQLVDGVGTDPDQIGPAETIDFLFDITGTGPFSMTDFTSTFSTIPPGDSPSLASAKFTGGPGGDSAYGAVVPVPAAVWLFGSALGLLGWLRRKTC